MSLGSPSVSGFRRPHHTPYHAPAFPPRICASQRSNFWLLIGGSGRVRPVFLGSAKTGFRRVAVGLDSGLMRRSYARGSIKFIRSRASLGKMVSQNPPSFRLFLL